ncbi:MAG: hypothetical protein IPL28_04735 [Chloroflexi bacterium]|nr:hypothetical protein [Chloroflexota bacterium]
MKHGGFLFTQLSPFLFAPLLMGRYNSQNIHGWANNMISIPELLIYKRVALVVIYLVLALVLFLRRRDPMRPIYWLLCFFLASAGWYLALVVFPANENGVLPTITLAPLLLATLLLWPTTTAYLQAQPSRWWLPLGLVATAAVFVIDQYTPPTYLVWPQLRVLPTVGGLVVVGGWLLFNLFTLGRTWLSYRRANFPWHANRYLMWLTGVTLVLVGDLLAFTADVTIIFVGELIRLLGVSWLAYVVSSYIRFDIRTRFRTVLVYTIIALVSALPATALFFLFLWLNGWLEIQYTAALVIIVASVAFLFYQPYRRLVERIVYRYLIGREFQTSQLSRNYSQSVSRMLDMEQLASSSIGFLSDLFDVQRGALLLISPKNDAFEVEPIPAMGQIPRQKRLFPNTSPFLLELTHRHEPLLQYEIDFNHDYRPIKHEVHSWLAELAMELYIPIQSAGQLTGIIALGPKSSGHIYQANELEAVQLLGDQTVAPLANARLYSEVEQQNEKVRLLNEDLVSQNERLEIMDKVKSDFITIASHELRTPLTQVKGYADILGVMNEENSLTREQTRQIVGHINRATRQLEKLISAMLDASQIDVDEMHMTFVQTQMRLVINLSLEPLVKAMRERRITLVEEGIDGLPALYADSKRLVQAFTNLLGNAVKYTPDGGKITVRGNLLGGDGSERYLQIAIIDTGIGIDLQYQTLIFEKFFRIGDPQLHSTGSTKFLGAGPGLGLPIAKGVIEGHGGRIWVESEGEDMQRFPGSTFSIILPLTPPKMPEMPTPNGMKDTQERPAWLIG